MIAMLPCIRERVNREVQNRELIGWQRRGCRERCREGPEKGRIHRELEAKMAPNRELVRKICAPIPSDTKLLRK